MKSLFFSITQRFLFFESVDLSIDFVILCVILCLVSLFFMEVVLCCRARNAGAVSL